MLPTGTRSDRDDLKNKQDLSALPPAGVRRISEYASSLFQHAMIVPKDDESRPKTRRFHDKTVCDDSFAGATSLPFAQTRR
jgi:hypothetical protein